MSAARLFTRTNKTYLASSLTYGLSFDSTPLMLAGLESDAWLAVSAEALVSTLAFLFFAVFSMDGADMLGGCGV